MIYPVCLTVSISSEKYAIKQSSNIPTRQSCGYQNWPIRRSKEPLMHPARSVGTEGTPASFFLFFLSHDSRKINGIRGRTSLIALEHPKSSSLTQRRPTTPPPPLFTSISTPGGGMTPPSTPISMQRPLLHSHSRLP
jgi:hypothetical protein